jgi:hypothetical protein
VLGDKEGSSLHKGAEEVRDKKGMKSERNES